MVSKSKTPLLIEKTEDIFDEGAYAPHFFSDSDNIEPVQVDRISRYLENLDYENELNAEIIRTKFIIYDFTTVCTHYLCMVLPDTNILLIGLDYTNPGWFWGVGAQLILSENCTITQLDYADFGYSSDMQGMFSFLQDRYPEYQLISLPDGEWATKMPSYKATPVGITSMSMLWQFLLDFNAEVNNKISPPTFLETDEVMYNLAQIPKVSLTWGWANKNYIENTVYWTPPRHNPKFTLFAGGKMIPVTVTHYNLNADKIPKSNVAYDESNTPTWSEQNWAFDPEIATGYFGNVGWFTPATFQAWGVSIQTYPQYGCIVGNIGDTLVMDGFRKSFYTIERTPVVLFLPKQAFGRNDVDLSKIPEPLTKSKDALKLQKTLREYCKQFLSQSPSSIITVDDAGLHSEAMNSTVTPTTNYTKLLDVANDKKNMVLESWVTKSIATLSLAELRGRVLK